MLVRIDESSSTTMMGLCGGNIVGLYLDHWAMYGLSDQFQRLT
jgi:hypothetical protein